MSDLSVQVSDDVVASEIKQLKKEFNNCLSPVDTPDALYITIADHNITYLRETIEKMLRRVQQRAFEAGKQARNVELYMEKSAR